MGTKISRPLIAHIASRATPTALQNPPEAAAPALARNAEISVRLAAAATAAWAAAVSAVTGCSSISSINTLADADTLREATLDRSRVVSRPRPEPSIVRKPSSRPFGPLCVEPALTEGHACESTGISLLKRLGQLDCFPNMGQARLVRWYWWRRQTPGADDGGWLAAAAKRILSASLLVREAGRVKIMACSG